MKKFRSALFISFFIVLNISGFAQGNDTTYLRSKTGKWSVKMTIQPAADAREMVMEGMQAERSMIGPYCLHEVMHPVSGASMPDFTRLADLAYNKNEDRWDYMSIDTRITGGIMYFTYSGSTPSTISSFIISVPNSGFGPQMMGRGQALHIRNEVIRVTDDHDMVRQYWKATDQKEWLAIQYDYVRVK